MHERPGVAQVVMPQMGESLSEGTDRQVAQGASAIASVMTSRSSSSRPTRWTPTCPAPAAGVLSADPGRGRRDRHRRHACRADRDRRGATLHRRRLQPPRRCPAAPAPRRQPRRTEEPGGHFKSTHAPQLVSFRRERGANRPRPRRQRHCRVSASRTSSPLPARMRPIARSRRQCSPRRVARACRSIA